MTEDQLGPAQGEENSTPDTNTDDEIEAAAAAQEQAVPAIPVAEESAPVPPPPPSGPRIFPQHYTILFGAVMVLVGAISVWHRPTVFGTEVRGLNTITGSFLLAMSLYTIIVGMLNIMAGRLKGMFAAFVLGVTALWFGLRVLLRTTGHDAFMNFADIGDLPHLETRQDQVYEFLGQIAPGVWWTVIGGLLIVFVYFKAILGGGKKQAAAPAPASAQRRRGSRR